MQCANEHFILNQLVGDSDDVHMSAYDGLLFSFFTRHAYVLHTTFCIELCKLLYNCVVPLAIMNVLTP